MPGIAPKQQDIDSFVQITNTDTNTAGHYLETGTTLEGALEDFFAASQASQPDPSPGSNPAALEPDTETETQLDSPQPERDVNMSDNNNADAPSNPTGNPAGPRTLSGAAVDDRLPSGWGQPERRVGRIGEPGGGQAARRPGEVATLFNTGNDAAQPGMPGGFGAPGRGGQDDDDDEDDEDDAFGRPRRPEELYAGGERSGLAIQNPNDGPSGQGQQGGGGARNIVRDILRQAAGNTPHDEPTAPGGNGPRGGGGGGSSFFGGTGHTLGSDEAPSVAVGGPSGSGSGSGPSSGSGGPSITAVTPSMMDNLLGMLGGGGAGAGASRAPPPPPPQEEEEVQTRQLTFWRNGFSIEDGPLMEYDAPGNREVLAAIQAGRAPPSLFGVRFDQPLQVEVAQRTNEEYVQQTKKMVNFGGEGNRLGSVTPGVAGGSGTATPTPPSASVPAQQQGGGGGFELDASQPSTSVQVRLADGAKLVVKLNLTHTVGDLRSYITASHPTTRSFVLQTTFPSKVLDDATQSVEQAKLQNAVVVQRYT